MPVVSLREYARLRGVDLKAVQKAIERGQLSSSLVGSKGNRKLIDSELADREWPKGTQEIFNGGKRDEPAKEGPQNDSPEDKIKSSYQQSRALREAYLARIVRLEYEEKAKEMLKAKDVEAEWTRIAGDLARTIRSIPVKVRQRANHLSDEDYKIIEAICDEALALCEKAI